MGHELGTDDPDAIGVRAVFRQQVAGALEWLPPQAPSDADVHAARKELKKARATLRLLRDAVGEAEYRRMNAVLRDAARPLSVARDGRVMLETLERLIERYDLRARGVPVDGLLRVLREEHDDARRTLDRQAMAPPRAALGRVLEDSAGWRIGMHGWDVIGAGVARMYRNGRQAFRLAQSRRTTRDLHEWRKQVKYLWHALQVLRPIERRVLGELAQQAHALADRLGDDHDLAVLRDKVLQHGDAFPDAYGRWRLLVFIDRRRATLQRAAFMLGAGIYAERPRSFEVRLARYWAEWREAPAAATP